MPAVLIFFSERLQESRFPGAVFRDEPVIAAKAGLTSRRFGKADALLVVFRFFGRVAVAAACFFEFRERGNGPPVDFGGGGSG